MNTTSFPFKWWALIGLSLLSFTAFLDFTIVSTAIPFIQKSLHASVLDLQWVNNIFALVLSMFMIAAGYFGDRFGRRRIYYFGFIFFAIAAIGAALSQSIEWLIFFRAVQGFAAAIIFTTGVALLPQAFPADEQNRAIGIFSAITGIGLVIGPFLGGLLITYLNWRWVFWVNIPIIVIGLLMCSFSLQAPPKGNIDARMDWWGFVLLIIGIGCLIYGLIHGEQMGWALASTWAYIILGIIGMIVLLIVECRLEHPMLELSVLKNPLTRLATLCACAAGLVNLVLFFFDPLFLNITRGETAFVIGALLLATPVVQVILSLQLSRLIKAFGLIGLFIIALLAGLVSSVLHGFLTTLSPLWFIVLAFALMGVTWGGSQQRCNCSSKLFY